MANKVLSIYVGNDAIRIAEMQANGKQAVVLSNAAEIATPSGAISDGYLVDITAIAEAIRTSIFGRGFTAKDVVFTISSKKIASKEIEVPYMKNTRRMNDILVSNSSEYFPMSNSDDYVFSFSVLETLEVEGAKTNRVSAVAAPIDLVKSYQELARELKFNVKAIDYFGNSVIQLLSMQMSEGRTDLVLQIENDATFVNVMRGKTLVLQRSVPYGKNAVINALMDVKKISEKDAKTLLSNETLLDQHVTADEYAQTVSYLVNGIGRVVEYHRTKNKNDLLQGIKIFGEGSAIAGIEKILERELGAPVEHFETLSGVTIRGQAALTAEEVLRYLPNIGAVIAPMNLAFVERKGGSSIGSAEVTKYMIIVFAVCALVMGIWCAVTLIQYNKAVKENQRLTAAIEDIQEVEDIYNDWLRSKAELRTVQNFQLSTYNDNENLVALLEFMEERFPTDTTINDLDAQDGVVTITITSGWHDVTKNELADVLNELQTKDFIADYLVEKYDEEFRYLVVTGINPDGSYEFEREEPEEGKDLGKYKEVDPYSLEEGYEDAVLYMQIQSTYELTITLTNPSIEQRRAEIEAEAAQDAAEQAAFGMDDENAVEEVEE